MLKHLLAGAAALALANAAYAETYAIQAGHLIVDAAQAERGPSTVVVENGRITRIDNGFTAPPGAIVIDQRCATYPAIRLPRGMPPRKASMKIDITRPRISSLVVSCTSEL